MNKIEVLPETARLKLLNCYFAASRSCNLRCSYCYVPSENKNNRDQLQDEVALIGFDHLLEKATREGFVFNQFTLHGAEPLMLSLKTIETIFDRITHHSPNCLIGLQTNGTLLTNDCVSVLLEAAKKAKNRYLYGVSIDGPPEIHNKNRSNTYDTIWKNVTNAFNRGLHLNFLVGVNSTTLDYLPELENWINHLILKNIRFRFKFIHDSSETTKNYQLTNDQQVLFARWLYKTGLMKYTGSFNPLLCIQAGNSCHWFEFDPEGGVYSCNVNFSEEKKFANWRTSSFEELFLKRKLLFKNSPVNSECFECPHRKKCNSGCPSERLEGKAIDCTIRRTIYDLMSEDNEDIEKFWNEQAHFYSLRRSSK